MSNIRLEITVLIICLIMAVIPVTAGSASNEAGKTKVITENYNGKTIQIPYGQSLCLKLLENPSTGYSWQLGLSKGLKQLSSKYYSPNDIGQRPMVGASGFHAWKIKATARGCQQIKGIYRRSWEKGTDKEHTFILNVKVV